MAVRIRLFDVLSGALVLTGGAVILSQFQQQRRERLRDLQLARQRGQPRQRAVVVGSGFAGLTAVNHLAALLDGDPSTDLLLVDRQNYHLFYPLLYQVATGGVEPGSLTFAARVVASEHGFRYLQATVKNVNLADQQLETDAGSIHYDTLILAPGSVTNFFGMADAAQNSLPLKSLEDGMNLRNQIVDTFERADHESDGERRRALLTFVIVGGGATGVELAASMSDLIRRTLIPNYPTIDAEDVRLVLVEARGALLAGWNPKMGELAAHRLHQNKVELMVNTAVSHVTDAGIETIEGVKIPSATVIWTAGIKAAPLVETLGVERERDGRVRVNDTFELPNQPGVFVIGDAAAVRPPGCERPLPPTASVAVDEGPFAAENALRRLHDQDPRTFEYHSRGDLVSLGRGAAAANVLGLVFDGIPAWLVRRTVYLVYLAGLRNRAFVVLDWLFVSFHQRVIASFDGVTRGRLVLPRVAGPEGRAQTRSRGAGGS